MDKDGDGLLSLEEAVRSITEIEGLEHPEHPELLAERDRHVEQLKANFAKSAPWCRSRLGRRIGRFGQETGAKRGVSASNAGVLVRKPGAEALNEL